MLFIQTYFVALVLFFVMDLIWLNTVAKKIFEQEIGFLMLAQVKWVPALIFYLVYIVALVIFAIIPSLKEHAWKEAGWLLAFSYGCLLGFVTYAAYDLTNLATLKGWSAKVVVYDLSWGTFLSGSTALLTYWIMNYFHNVKNH